MSSSPDLATAVADSDAEQLRKLGYTSNFNRSMSLWENFALGFTYLSPVVGVYTLFGLCLAAGGPPMFWAYLLVGCGQLLVCLIFGEVVSQFPISGGVYPWARRLVGKKWAWMVGWIYSIALCVTIAAVAVGAGPYLAAMLGFEPSNNTNIVIALVLTLFATLVNLSGTKVLARIAMFGFLCELVGAVIVGVYLLVFERHQPLSVLFNTFDISVDGSYLPAFLTASLAAMFACLALILAVPDMQAVINGTDKDPVTTILNNAFGPVGSKVVMGVVMISFISCVISLQAAASRLLYSYARDEMVIGSRLLKKISPTTQVPVAALFVSGVLPALIIALGFFLQDAVATIVSFAAIGIYLAFQMIVLAALYARSKGWKPSGKFTLGAWGWPVNIGALVYGVGAIINMAWPRTPDAAWYVNYAMVLSTAIVIGLGLVYMWIGKPYDHGKAPAGDAWKVSR
jgi:amino acid transporter